MSGYLGDFPVNHVNVCDAFGSFAASDGSNTATSNFAAGDVSIYKDNSNTQRSSSAGITVTTSFDSVTGIQSVNIDLSDNTDAGFYAAGHEYFVVIGPITVDGQTLYFPAFSFSIERAGGILALLKATGSIKVDVNKWLSTTVSTPTVAGVPNVNTKTWNDLATVALPLVPTTAGRTLDVSATGEAGLDWANVGSPTTTLGLSGTTIKAVTDAQADSSGVTTLLSRLSATRAGYLDNLSAGAVALEASLQGLITTIGASAVNVGTAVWASATRLLTAGTNIVLAKGVGVTGFTDLDAAGVRGAVGLASANLDTQLSTIAGYIDTEVAAIVTAVLAVKAKTDNLPASPAAIGSPMTLTAGERDAIAAAAQDLVDGIEAGLTPRQSSRLMLAALAGKISGAATNTIAIRNASVDTKDRIVATVDPDGNRTAITLDVS